MPDDNLIEAVKTGNYQYLNEYLNSGQTLNAIGSDGKSALLVAADMQDPTMVKWLLGHGADVDFYDPEYNIIDRTAFLYAGANGLNDILEILIPYQPDVSIRNGYGGNALIPAAEKGHVATVKLLLEKTGVDVNFVNHLGWTALLEVTLFGKDNTEYQEIVRLLLEHGAAPRLADKEGVMPLEHARQRNLTLIIPLLEKE
jgi:ankyrin repeat protein